jgi:hypothetical protein
VRALTLAVCVWAFAQNADAQQPVVAPPAASAATVEPVEKDAPPTVAIAVLNGTNKITGRTTRIETAVGTLERFGNLEIVVQKCENSPANVKPKESAVLVDVWELKPSERPVQVFNGWLFATNASLSTMQHPVYDLSLEGCAESTSVPQ